MKPISFYVACWANGNYGAVNFVHKLGYELQVDKANDIFDKLEECTTIRGTNLWVLYSDLCEKDLNKVHELCQKCPNDILEDACSRQDYSGRKLVAQYLPEPKAICKPDALLEL